MTCGGYARGTNFFTIGYEDIKTPGRHGQGKVLGGTELDLTGQCLVRSGLHELLESLELAKFGLFDPSLWQSAHYAPVQRLLIFVYQV